MKQLWGTVYAGNKVSRKEALKLHKKMKADISVEFEEKRAGIIYGIFIGYKRSDECPSDSIRTFAELMQIFRESVATLYELPTFLENGNADLLERQQIFARNSLVKRGK